MGALFYYKATSRKARKKCIGIVNCAALIAEICITNVLKFLSKVTLANLYLSINSTCLIIYKA